MLATLFALHLVLAAPSGPGRQPGPGEPTRRGGPGGLALRTPPPDQRAARATRSLHAGAHAEPARASTPPAPGGQPRRQLSLLSAEPLARRGRPRSSGRAGPRSGSPGPGAHAARRPRRVRRSRLGEDGAAPRRLLSPPARHGRRVRHRRPDRARLVCELRRRAGSTTRTTRSRRRARPRARPVHAHDERHHLALRRGADHGDRQARRRPLVHPALRGLVRDAALRRAHDRRPRRARLPRRLGRRPAARGHGRPAVPRARGLSASCSPRPSTSRRRWRRYRSG